MNLSTLFRSQLQSAGELGINTLKNFEHLVETLTSWGRAEHNADGTHNAITAASATIGVLTKGREIHNKIAIWDNAVATDGIIKGKSHYQVGSAPPIAFQDANVIVLINTAGGAAGIPQVEAMDSTGRTNGEIVWFLYYNANTGGGLDAIIVTRSTAHLGYTRFIEDPLVTNNRNLAQGRILPVMFFDIRNTGFFPGTPPDPRWYLGAGVT